MKVLDVCIVGRVIRFESYVLRQIDVFIQV